MRKVKGRGGNKWKRKPVKQGRLFEVQHTLHLFAILGCRALAVDDKLLPVGIQLGQRVVHVDSVWPLLGEIAVVTLSLIDR
jgi:hypothetical protein